MNAEKREWKSARQLKARNLRNQGFTFREVGEELGISKSRASQLVDIAERKQRVRQARFNSKAQEVLECMS